MMHYRPVQKACTAKAHTTRLTRLLVAAFVLINIEFLLLILFFCWEPAIATIAVVCYGSLVLLSWQHICRHGQDEGLLNGIQEQAERSLAVLQATLEATDDGILAVDSNHGVLTYNQNFVKMWNIPETVFRSLPWQQRIELVAQQVKDPESFYNLIRTIYAAPELRQYEVVELTDGRVFELFTGPQVMGETVVGRVWSYRDITRHRQAEEALQHAKEMALAATRAKSNFLANMSHEIRTPLNAVMGMCDLLSQTRLTFEQSDYVETMASNNRALLALVDDILDFSKIESGQIDLERKPFSLRECIEQSLDMVAVRASEKHLGLSYMLDEHVPDVVVGDTRCLYKILVHLLSNGVKFTDQGEVVLSVTATDSCIRGENRHMLHFQVRDTGIGIPPDRMNVLFQLFSQVDSSMTRRHGGTGLGLAISKRLTELMGGTIWVESEMGQGTTFSFVIHAEPANEAAQQAMQATDLALSPHLQGKRVAIVCDAHSCSLLLVRSINRWGMTPVVVPEVHDTVSFLQEHGPCDVAVLDLHVFDLNGLAIVEQLRQVYDTRTLPLVMYVSLSVRGRVMEKIPESVTTFLFKPIKPDRLYRALVDIFENQAETTNDQETEADEQDAAEEIPPEAIHILVVEDNAFNQKVALRLLERLGYRADVAENGGEALKALDQQPYDVLLMDVQMPEMDGLEATRRIRAGRRADQQPWIIALTAHVLPEDRERCFEAGMDDYLSKPVQSASLSEALAKARQQIQTGQAHKTG